MTRLSFKYYMKLTFSDPVAKHRFSLKCTPKTDKDQRVWITRREVYPNSFISEGKDSFGNMIIYGYEESEHNKFFFDIEGMAETGITSNDDSGSDEMQSMFKYQTCVTRPGEAILDYFQDVFSGYSEESDGLYPLYGIEKGDDNLSFALYVMDRLGKNFNYVPGITDIGTTAEDAMKCKSGVCQDYAHIMLSLCRIKKIPCRYVTGMMLGEGKSHAWVEVYSGNKWIGMDPTNSQIVGDYYIKIAHGRDYRDCLVNQGVFTGNVTQVQEISVQVEEMV